MKLNEQKTTTSSSLSSSGIDLILPFPEKGNTVIKDEKDWIKMKWWAPWKKGLIIVQVPYRPTLPYPTSYLFAVPPSLCSPFLVSSLPSTRQHPISLSLHSLPSQKTLWLSQISRHNPCIGHHSLYLNSEGIFFHFLALWISGEIREGLMYHSISKYNAWMGGSLTLAWIFFRDLSTCTEGPQRWSFITKKWYFPTKVFLIPQKRSFNHIYLTFSLSNMIYALLLKKWFSLISNNFGNILLEYNIYYPNS